MGYSQPRRIEERVLHELLLAAILVLVAVVQVVLLPRPLGFPPNLMLMLVICHALATSPGRAARWAFYGGVALDFCSGSLIGTHALSLLVAVLVAALPLRRLSADNWLLPMLGSLLGAAGYYLVFGALTYLFDGPFDLQVFAMVAALPDMLFTLVPALPLFLFWRSLQSRWLGEGPISVY